MTFAFWHAIFVNFTFALTGAATIFYCVSLAFDSSEFAKNLKIAAIANLWLGLLLTVFTLLFGLLSFSTDGLSDATISHMADHRHWAYLALFLLGIVSLWSVQERKKTGVPFVTVLAITFLIILVTLVKGMNI